MRWAGTAGESSSEEDTHTLCLSVIWPRKISYFSSLVGKQPFFQWRGRGCAHNYVVNILSMEVSCQSIQLGCQCGSVGRAAAKNIGSNLPETSQFYDYS